MEKSRKAGFGMIALVALALVAAYAIGITTQGWVFASPNAQSTTGWALNSPQPQPAIASRPLPTKSSRCSTAS